MQTRLDDPELKPETESDIAAWLGHAWQLRELKDAGLVQANVELLQLAFNAHDDWTRKEFVETGVWLNLQTGAVQLTRNYRPYHAARHIREDDSCFHVMVCPELCVYPGNLNPRVRWEASEPRPATEADYARAREHARTDLRAVLKDVKTQLKSPLGDRHPVALVKYRALGRAGDELVIEDANGERLVLADDRHDGDPATLPLLPMLPKEVRHDQVMLVRFHHDLDSQKLRAKPLSIVTERDVIRLTLLTVMSLALIEESAKEVRRLAIAGSPLAVGDFRLKKLIPPLEQAGAKVPVFAQVAKSIGDLVNGKEADSAANLLNLSTLLNAILYTQGQSSTDGDYRELEVFATNCSSTRTTARELKPLVEALTSSGGGRFEVIKAACDRGAFNDLRLIDPAIQALGDNYPEMADLVAERILPATVRASCRDSRPPSISKARSPTRAS